MESVVVFPAPFPPSNAVIEERLREKDKSFTAVMLPNFLVREWVSRMVFKGFKKNEFGFNPQLNDLIRFQQPELLHLRYDFQRDNHNLKIYWLP